uniref:Cationic amino acid transporter C-terminal domain-containing protein n=1 Tax=Ananas comosus var. bracteatus TaxID=296719 RepID=A0A6V7NMG0_ANACO|nr:unnamed protein product [Ananas comosus var. bracteatus]
MGEAWGGRGRGGGGGAGARRGIFSRRSRSRAGGATGGRWGDGAEAPGPDRDEVGGERGDARGAGAERARDEEDPHVVRPHLLRHRRRHRRRHLRPHRPGGQRSRRPRRRPLLRRLRVSAMLSVFCYYTEFAVEIPVAGGSFAYLRVELGDFVAFIAAGNILLEYVIGGAAVARSWTSYFATLLNHQPADFRIHAHSLAADYNQLDPIAVAVIAIVCIAASLSTKGSSRFNYIASIIHLVVILFIIVAGLTKADTHNLSPSPLRAPRHLRLRRRALLRVRGVRRGVHHGRGDEEPGQGHPRRAGGRDDDHDRGLLHPGADAVHDAAVRADRQGRALLGGVPEGGHELGQVHRGVRRAQGHDDGAAGVGRGAGAVPDAHRADAHDAAVARAGAPAHGDPRQRHHRHARRHRRHRLLHRPRHPLSNLLSISTLFIFMVVALALLVRRYYVAGETSDANRSKLVACLVLILASSIATATYWGVSAKAKGWAAYVVTVPVWFLATLYLAAFVPKARQPKLWGVPLVPWLPSASIAINVFLLGSIDSKSFMRFGIWSAFLLLYYLFVGLHASYDTAKAAERSRNDGKAKELEEGVGLADASHIGGEK